MPGAWATTIKKIIKFPNILIHLFEIPADVKERFADQQGAHNHRKAQEHHSLSCKHTNTSYQVETHMPREEVTACEVGIPRL